MGNMPIFKASNSSVAQRELNLQSAHRWVYSDFKNWHIPHKLYKSRLRQLFIDWYLGYHRAATEFIKHIQCIVNTTRCFYV